MFDFHVMRGPDIRALIAESRPGVVDTVRRTYLAHHAGETINPNSYFLRFPDHPSARIIALPAALTAAPAVAGIKWIGSFPVNVRRNVPRASALLILNDMETGYPYACLEAAQISAARTAASAVLAAERLHGSRQAAKIAVVGAGVISRNVLEFLHDLGWRIGEVAVHDLDPPSADRAAGFASSLDFPGRVAGSLAAAVQGAGVVVLATTAAVPYLHDENTFEPGQTVLNLSLRDIGPEIILAANNILDDVDHCLTAGTSPHLAEQKFGHRHFIDGTIGDLLLGDLPLDERKPRIFSPFGLGVLDLAVGREVLNAGRTSGRVLAVPNFFAETARWDHDTVHTTSQGD
ncbi:2,3-diaminopropionate biosynthesis protein SbnB [Micromonospora sp. CNB394]|uniref:2,3-diaminopropionate biosynthesis protein SbnB n=1 Tax=Micromonospora sp. CNB394 TaxID=1169151 RepID=UPI00037F9796|nr:2,3-diaminopropionate biosynthesis protein SbnB [Micromonospora sp. CNB394]